MRISRLREINAAQANLAGPRYMPGMDPNAPSLRIQRVSDALDALGYTPAYYQRLASMRRALAKALRSSTVEGSFRGRAATPDRVNALLGELEGRTPDPIVE